MKPKKVLIQSAPYVTAGYLTDKLAQGYALAPGLDVGQKVINLSAGMGEAFSTLLPSFEPTDLLIGASGAVLLRLAVSMKAQNAKKYRHGIEYGSARCGA